MSRGGRLAAPPPPAGSALRRRAGDVADATVRLAMFPSLLLASLPRPGDARRARAWARYALSHHGAEADRFLAGFRPRPRLGDRWPPRDRVVLRIARRLVAAELAAPRPAPPVSALVR